MDVVTPLMNTPAPPRKKSSTLKRVASAMTHSYRKKGSINQRQGTLSIDNVGDADAMRDNQPIAPASMP